VTAAALPLALLCLFQNAPAPDDPAALVEKLRTEDASERRKAESSLLRLGAPGAAAAAKALVAAPADPAARVAELAVSLAAAAWKDRDRAMRDLARLGPPARAALLKHAESADPEVAWRVRAALAELGERAPREEALAALRDAALCRLLGELGGPEAAAALLRVASEPPGEPRAEPRLRALEALGKIRGLLSKAQAEETAERALAYLEKTPGARERGVLLRAIGRLKSTSAVRPLAALAEDRGEKNLHVRRAALAALAAAGDGDSTRAIVEALASDEPYVREAAAAALERIAGEVFGFDAAALPATSRGAVDKARAWWSTKYGKPWE
jgi:HEAT repeat protein